MSGCGEEVAALDTRLGDVITCCNKVLILSVWTWVQMLQYTYCLGWDGIKNITFQWKTFMLRSLSDFLFYEGQFKIV